MHRTHCVIDEQYQYLSLHQMLTWLSGYLSSVWFWARRGCNRMVVGFTTTCVIRAYHHLSCEFEARSFRGVLETTLCDQVCQWFATGRWYSPNTPVSSTNKTDRHNIADMLLNVVLNTITDSPSPQRMLLNNNAYFGYVELMSNISLTCV